MTAPADDSSDAALIQHELAEARRALDRYYQLSTFENRAQQDRLAGVEEHLERLERSLDRLEHAVEGLRQQVAGILDSRIWRLLVRFAGLLGKVSGKRSGS